MNITKCHLIPNQGICRSVTGYSIDTTKKEALQIAKILAYVSNLDASSDEDKLLAQDFVCQYSRQEKRKIVGDTND